MNPKEARMLGFAYALAMWTAEQVVPGYASSRFKCVFDQTPYPVLNAQEEAVPAIALYNRLRDSVCMLPDYDLWRLAKDTAGGTLLHLEGLEHIGKAMLKY